MSDLEIYGIIGALAIISGFILFAIWQGLSTSKPENFDINPEEIEPFASYKHTFKEWYVLRPRHWPPLKLNKDRDRCGLCSIYQNNQTLLGHIKIFNSYASFLEFQGHEIHAVPTLQNFTNFPQKIDFIDKPSNELIFSLKPDKSRLGLSFHYRFQYKDTNYTFKSISTHRWIGELYSEQALVGVFAITTAKQIRSAICLDTVEPAILMVCFDIFRRV